jgi:hypothetical protein
LAWGLGWDFAGVEAVRERVKMLGISESLQSKERVLAPALLANVLDGVGQFFNKGGL